jgi:transcriptional regulator of acetoin/glycerol metabolism
MQTSAEQDEVVRMVGQLAQGRILPLRNARRTVVHWALEQANGNVSHAAQMLGISRGTIYRYARP